jgi:hypothetical protein
MGRGAWLLAAIALMSMAVFAAPAAAGDKAKVQDRLNNEVLDQGFDVKGEAELNSYIEEATRKGLEPKRYTGNHWRRGYTCEDLRRYSWSEYRDCVYYYRYHGRYYDYP